MYLQTTLRLLKYGATLCERDFLDPGEVRRVVHVGIQSWVVLVTTAVASRHYARQHEMPKGILRH